MITATAAARKRCECYCARQQQFGDADRADDGDDDDELPRRRRVSMTGRRPGAPLALLLLVLLGAALHGCDAVLSNLRLCYDERCSVVISKGRTAVPYHSNDRDVLSFPGNAEVKVFSKAAGDRKDLWGIEIIRSGKRGYAPKNLIRETAVYHEDLKHQVPVEKSSEKESKNATKELQKPTEDNSNTNSGTAQDNSKQSEVPETELNKPLEESVVDPAQISPSYDNVYDGTIIPEDFDSAEPSPPRYSTQTLQDSVEREDVQLNVYPNILKSSFSLLSNILGNDKEESDEETVNVDSSEKVLNEETTEKTPEIEKTDKSSLSSDEKHVSISEEVKPEDVTEDISKEGISKEVLPESHQNNDDKKSDSLTQSEVNPSDTVDKLDSSKAEVKEVPEEPKAQKESKVPEEPEQPKVQKSSEVPEKTEAQKESEVPEEPEQPKVQKLSELPEKPEAQKKSEVPEKPEQPKVQKLSELSEKPEAQKKSEVPEKLEQPKVQKLSELPEKPEVQESIPSNEVVKEETVAKSTEQSESQNENVAETKENLGDNVGAELVNSLNNSVHIENNTTESLSSVENSTDKNLNSDIVENAQSASDNVQNEIVPKKEVDEVPLNPHIENVTGDSSSPAEQAVSDTSVNSTNIEDAIIQKVPLNQEVKETEVTPKSFISNEELPLPNISENERKLTEGHVEISDNLTTSNVFNEESKLVDGSLNLEKMKEANDNIVDNNNNVIDDSYTTVPPAYLHNDSVIESPEPNFQSTDSSQEHTVDIPSTPSIGEFLGNRNLLNAGKDSEEIGVDQVIVQNEVIQTPPPFTSEENFSGEIKYEEENISAEDIPLASNLEKLVIPPETCDKNYGCSDDHGKHHYSADENAVTNTRIVADSSETLLYVCITAVTTLLFSLGYYFIENRRRDAFLIGKINNLEKDLMVTRKECIMLDENFKSTKTKLDSIEDESFGSNEMVLSLKAELAASESTRVELEEQIASLERELESTSEAGLELERMLREILSSQSEENNPLAQSIEDLQVRLNDQQVANESLKSALAIKTQENETLTGDLTVSLKKVEQLQSEVTKLTEELKIQTSTKIQLEQTLTDQVQSLEIQIKTMTEERSHIKKQLKMKELEVKELLDVIEQMNINSLDFEKLYEVSHIKAEAAHLLEERDELKVKLSEEEGAHQLLEEHVKLVKEEVALLSEQCRIAEKEKKEAETKLEVLTKFFEEKEAQRQKEETLWLEKQGEVSSTVERLHTMQNEILNYKQQIEVLKREIVDQEREYKHQISALETKAHEQWVAARQNERRLEEVKAESSQLRNRLTLVEKNINDVDPEVKLHRLQTANGETPGHPLFPSGGENSSSPLMFGAGGAGVPPPLPPPSYMYGPGPFPPPPFLPPPLPTSGASAGELVGSRPPPLGGGRLSSPPPGGGQPQSGPQQQSSAASPPMSPPPLPFPPPPHHHHQHHHHPGLRSPPPPLPPFGVEMPLHHLPPPPLPMSHHHQADAHNAWGDEALPPLRNPAFHQQRSRNHKGSLHSSGESLDKSHHGGKV